MRTLSHELTCWFFSAVYISQCLVVFLHSRGSTNYRPWVKPNPPSIFVNKVLLVHRHNCLFTYHLWLFSCYNNRVAQFCDCRAWKFLNKNVKYFLCDPSPGKFAEPCSVKTRHTIISPPKILGLTMIASVKTY